MRFTSSAWRPFGPFFTSKDTRAPSSSERYPLAAIAEKWTKTSSPFSRWINPNPLAALNHFTIPVSFKTTPSASDHGRIRLRVAQPWNQRSESRSSGIQQTYADDNGSSLAGNGAILQHA